MRPIELRMTAFGSYAEPTELNFDELDRGIYLITGDTGAGKTTIFDAIVFALYGRPSGGHREPKMMHSDYVDPGQKTVVQLKFEHGGKIHEVEREIPVTKKRSTGEYELGNIQARYWEADKPVLEGAQKVTGRITEQLGLSADQFSKIVMLAQGEFRKFLDSTDDERADIMRRLFDFSTYTKMQRWLEASAARLENQRRDLVDRRHTLMQAFRMPEGLTEEEQSRYHGSHPELMPSLERLCEEEAQILAIRGEAKEAAAKHRTDCTLKLDQASAHNKRLEELDRSRSRLTQLQEQDEENRLRHERIAAAGKALRQGKPLENAREEARAARKKLEQEILQQTVTIAEQKAVLTRAEQQRDAAHSKEGEIQELGTAIRLLEEMIPGYEQLDELRRSLKKAEKRSAAADADQMTWETAKKTASERMTAVDEELVTLKDAGAALVAAENRQKQAERTMNELTRRNGLLQYVSSVRRGEEQVPLMKKEVLSLQNAALRANKDYTDAYQSFMANQAGFMGNDLAAWIAREGRAACPVCRTEFCQVPAHGFAIPMEEAATQAEVDEKKEFFEEADRIWREAAAKLQGHCAKVEETRGSAEQRAELIFGESVSWEVLSGREMDPAGQDPRVTYLQRRMNEFSDAVKTADRELEQARIRSERRQALEEERVRLTEQIAGADTKLAAVGEEQKKALEEVTRISEQIREKAATLSRYADAKEAMTEKQRKEQQRAELTGQIAQADKEWKNISDLHSRSVGALEKMNAELPGRQEKEKTAEEKFAGEILHQGFADEQAYRCALPPVEGIRAGEDWIAGQLEICQTYEKECSDTAARVKTLEEETASWKMEDLEALRSALEEADEAVRAADAAFNDMNTLLESHRETWRNVKKISDSLHGTDQAYRRLSALSSLAVGSKGVGGMYSFERYVMGTSFREILDAANVRLAVMSGGRYELVHKIAGKRVDSKVGLGIEVLDNGTRKQREAGSISGGESFQVSMALALGLSDVVQRHAGSQPIDSMFIDEGFGSLSEQALEQAVSVLDQLAGDTRQIGIISHVGKLEEIIGNRIVVTRGEKGSTAAVQR